MGLATWPAPVAAQWYQEPGYTALEQDRTFFFRADWHLGSNRTISELPWVTDLMQGSSYSALDFRVGTQSSIRQ